MNTRIWDEYENDIFTFLPMADGREVGVNLNKVVAIEVRSNAGGVVLLTAAGEFVLAVASIDELLDLLREQQNAMLPGSSEAVT